MNLTARIVRRVTIVTGLTILTAATGAAASMAATAQAATSIPAKAAAATPAKAAIPAKFKAASLSWLSGTHGWLLGSAPCGKASCTDVLSTGNGGGSWSLAGSIKAPIGTNATPADVGVDEIRPLTASVGWAYGPALFRTANGGKTWTAQPIPGHGHQILALAHSASGSYAVVSPCQEFAQHCTSKQLTFWRTASLTGTTWTRIKASLAIDSAASISTSGRTVYVVGPGQPGQLLVSTDGKHFAAGHSPCNAAQDFGLDQVSASSATHVALLCIGNAGRSEATKTVYRSVNNGKTVTSAGTTPVFGIPAEVAASTSGDLLVGSWSEGTFMYANDGGKTKWTMPIGLNTGDGWNDLAFVSGRVAWAVYGPVSTLASDPGQLFVTRDGGQHWKRITV